MKKLKLNKYFLLLSSISFLIILQSCESNKSDLVIAEFGNDKIFQSDFISRYEDYLIQTGINDNIISRKEVLNSMIAEVLLYEYDDNNEIFNDTEYQKELKWTENQVVLAYLKDREVYAKISVTDEEVREAFLRSNQKIAARHLFARTEEEINNIAQLLEIGVDFNKLAQQTFTDSTLRVNGGYLGYFSWGDMEPEFENKAFSMKIGEISRPVKTKNGFSIIKLEDRVTHPLLTENEFLNKKDKLNQIVRIRKKLPAEKKFVNDAVNFDSIRFRENQIEKLWENFELNIIEKGEIVSDMEDEIAVEYQDKSYTTEELRNRINLIPQYHLEKISSKDKLKTVIKGLILQERLLEMAEDKEYDDVVHVEKKFDQKKINLFMKYKISEIVENASIEDSVIFNFYNKNPEFFSTHEQVNVQEILVEELSLAKSLVEKIENGFDFGELAKKYSIRESTSQNNGVIGLMPLKNFGKFKSLFNNATLNEVIGPIELNDVFGIFRVIDRKLSEPIEYEEAEEVATLAVKFKLKNEILNNYVENLKQRVTVSINLENLGSAKIFQFN